MGGREKNAILQVDYTSELRARGLPRLELSSRATGPGCGPSS
jgi:hypothetical protein